MPASDTPGVDFRVSDAERDRALESLRAHHAEGRLTFEEFEERVEEAYRARSTSGLAYALRELPPTHDSSRQARRRPRRRPRLSGWWLRVNGICTAVWAATTIGSGGLHYFWPMWVMLGTTIPLIAAGRGARIAAAEIGCEQPIPGQPLPTDQEMSQRIVTTLLFVDIVQSTERAAGMGDAAWNRLVDSYQRLVRDDLMACGGQELFMKGDEFVVAFSSSAGAVRCGLAVRDHARQLGLETRIGVHAGEVEQQGRAMRGLAMHIGQRVCACARPGELLVSSTVRDLLVGSGLTFRNAGEHELKGLEGVWRLYALAE